MKQLLFVCTSNFVRSPLAAASFNAIAAAQGIDDRVFAESAGAFPGQSARPPDRRAIEVARRHGLDITEHRTRAIEGVNLAQFDLILALDEDSYWHVRRIHPDIELKRLKLFLEYSRQLGVREVPDPVALDESFDAVYDLIARTNENLVETLMKDEAL